MKSHDIIRPETLAIVATETPVWLNAVLGVLVEKEVSFSVTFGEKGISCRVFNLTDEEYYNLMCGEVHLVDKMKS